MTKSSVNFKNVRNVAHAISHTARTVSPLYLLPEDKSLGVICLLDDEGMVAAVHKNKLGLASSQALRSHGYSPVWEGILNLPRPDFGAPDFDSLAYKKYCSDITISWIKQYELTTGHKVLRADIHLDEGHMEDGEALLNSHAHIIADRTNEKGRVLKLVPKQLRDLQTLTAEVTGLDRGESSRKTGRKHISHQAYKYLAERGRLEAQQQADALVATHKIQLEKPKDDLVRLQKLSKEWSDTDLAEIRNLKVRAARLTAVKDGYKAERDALKASGIATQQDYQALKTAHLEALAELNSAKEKLVVSGGKLKKPESENTVFKELVTALEAAKNSPTLPNKPPTEALKQPKEAFSSQTPTNPMPSPEKSLPELLKASFAAFVDWILGEGGQQQEVLANSHFIGPVIQRDELHAVQRVGRGSYAIHNLDQLDKVPQLDDPAMEIRYRDGLGVVKDFGREPKMR